jgi:hypothetical protein
MSAESAGSYPVNIRDVKATGYQSECGGSIDGERPTCLIESLDMDLHGRVMFSAAFVPCAPAM